MRIRWNIASSAGFEWPTGYSSGWLLVLVNIAGPLMRNSRECLRFSASYVQFCTAVAFPERQMAGSDVSFRLLIKSFQPFSSVDLHLGGRREEEKKIPRKRRDSKKRSTPVFIDFRSVKRKKNIVDDFKKKKREREKEKEKSNISRRDERTQLRTFVLLESSNLIDRTNRINFSKNKTNKRIKTDRCATRATIEQTIKTRFLKL